MPTINLEINLFKGNEQVHSTTIWVKGMGYQETKTYRSAPILKNFDKVVVSAYVNAEELWSAGLRSHIQKTNDPDETVIPVFVSEKHSITRWWDDEIYLAAVYRTLQAIHESLQRIDDLLLLPDPYSPIWLGDVETELARLNMLLQEFKEIEPPGHLADVHAQYARAIEHVERVSEWLEEAMDNNLDPVFVVEAEADLEAATLALKEANAMLEGYMAGGGAGR